MTADSTNYIALPDGWQPSWIQSEIVEAETRIVVACCGRRVGKTWVGVLWTIDRICQRVARRLEEIRDGKARRWEGLGKSAKVAKFLQPDILVWCVAPRETHLDDAKSQFLRLFTGDWSRFLHPAFDGGLYDRGHQLWLLFSGVCVRIDFVPAASEARMVSKGLDIVWIDEAGFVPNDRFRALKPATMDRKSDILATGTPSLGDSHWFTRLAASGLTSDHERYNAHISEKDPEVTTFIADTFTHAALPEARTEAIREEAFWGKDFADLWLRADWRTKGRHVFPMWRPDLHVVQYTTGRGWRVGGRPLPRPDHVWGAVDWSGGAAPGAATVVHVWRRHPLSPLDPRPLMVIVEDSQGKQAYTDDGWWGILRSLDQRWGVDRWVGDPHSPHLITQARGAGLYVEPGPHADKAGRINVVAGLLHHDPSKSVSPALLVSDRCTHVPRQFAQYSWRVSRDGAVQDQPRQYDDHCLDCIAMLAGEIVSGSGGIAIGGALYG
jgi:hypothetical protein